MSLPSSIMSSNIRAPISVVLSPSSQSHIVKKKYELSEIEQKYLDALNKRLMSLANLRSFAGACEASESLGEEQKTLFKIVKRSKYFEHEKIAAANCMSILNHTGYSFSRRNLRKVRIPGAHLEGANLIGTDFSKADLTGVTIIRAVMNYALFNGTLMEGVRLGQLPLIKCLGVVEVLCLTKDGKRIIGAVGKNIYVWEVETGQELRRLEGHTEEVKTLTLIRDGKQLISGSLDGTIRLWDIDTSQELKKFKELKRDLITITSFPDGTKLAYSSENTIIILDIESEQELQKLKGHTESVAVLVIFPNGKKLASGSFDKTILIWDPETDQKPRKLEGHTDKIWTLALFPDGKKLASGSLDMTIRIWDVNTSQTLKTFQGHFIMTLFPDGKKIASGNLDKIVRILDVETGEELQKLEGHTGGITALYMFPDGKRLVSSSYNQFIIWELEDKSKKLEDSSIRVSAILFQDDENLLTVARGRNIDLWNLESRKEIGRLEGHTGRVTVLAHLPEKKLASGSEDTTIRIWDLETGQEVKKLDRHRKEIIVIAFSCDGKRLVSGSKDCTIQVWDLEVDKEPLTILGYNSFVDNLVLFNKKIFASIDWDRRINTWEIETGKELQKLEGHIGRITALALSPKGKRLASGSQDNAICTWDLRNENLKKKLEGHSREVTSIAYFQDGKRLVSGSRDKTIRIWDLHTKKEMIILSHPFPLSSIDLKNDQFLCIMDGLSGLWMWKLHFQKNSIKPELLWTTHPGLSCDKAEISQAIGLSEANRQLMIQHGAMS